MRQSFRRLMGVWSLLLVLAPAQAAADRVDRLVQMYRPGVDAKVRLQVVQVLGKLRSRRAVPTLLRALEDPVPVVRGMAVMALWRVGDLAAVHSLRRRLTLESNADVKERLSKALDAMVPLLSGPPRGVRYLVSIGALRNRSAVAHKDVTRVLRDALYRELQGVPHVTTRWAAGRPTREALARHGVRGYLLDATVTAAGAQPLGGKVRLYAKVRYTLRPMFGADRTGRSFPGNARHPVPRGHYKQQLLGPYVVDLMEVSARVARQNIAQRYLRKR